MRRIRTVLLIITIVSLLIGISAAFFAGMGPTVAQDTETLQLAPLNPDFLDYLDNPYEPLYGYIPPPVSLSHLSEIPMPRMAALTLLPSAFDWRDKDGQDWVTPVKNQNPCGTCWIFGTIAAIESRVLIEEGVEYDFSEQNVACCTDPSWVDLAADRCGAGGWSWLATDVLTKKGTRLESCDPYDTGTINTELCDDACTTIKRVTGYRWVADSPDQIDEVKNAIYSDGPVSMAYYHTDNPSRWSGSIYYYPNCDELANHLVTIVGWDDDIAHPAGGGSGVWIVKNSWGTGWGDDGYFYLCYGSAKMQEVASYRYQDYHPGERVYFWDEAGRVHNVGYSGSDSAWMANVFTCEQDGDLTHVDFWTTSNGAQYELYVYDGSLPDSLGSLRASKSGTCDELGYYSIPLDTQVPMTAAQQFTVAVKMTTLGHIYPLPVEFEIPGTVEPPIQSGVCFSRHYDWSSWDDVAPSGYNFCLRAKILTNAPPSVASVEINPDPSYTDTDLTAVPSGWDDADGDPQIPSMAPTS
jgi:C1A family cysteine protease